MLTLFPIISMWGYGRWLNFMMEWDIVECLCLSLIGCIAQTTRVSCSRRLQRLTLYMNPIPSAVSRGGSWWWLWRLLRWWRHIIEMLWSIIVQGWSLLLVVAYTDVRWVIFCIFRCEFCWGCCFEKLEASYSTVLIYVHMKSFSMIVMSVMSLNMLSH